MELAGPFNGHVVAIGDELVEGLVEAGGRAGIELVGVAAHDDLLAVLESGKGEVELARTEVAEGTDDVSPDVDHKGVTHGSMVSQISRYDRMVGWFTEG